ncbi:MAG: response regulator [Candidatus Omnitrophota bacterium]
MSKVKVLIIDDEVDYLSVMKERLESWGYEVILAQGGKEGLAEVKEKSPDIVILDYFMPDMDGVAVLKEIRKFNKSLAVIMLTAHADIKNIKSAQELGVSTFIPKLSPYSDVQASLRSALDMASKKIKDNKG